MTQRLPVAAFGALLLALIGCGRSPAAPTAAGTWSAASAMDAPAVVVAVAVGGMRVRATVGEKMQLTASAIYSDGSTRGITGEATWETTDAAVVTVSSQGLVTFVGSGRAVVSATYEAKTGALTLRSTAVNVK